MELKDKTAVVTGGNSGIGKAMCEALGKEGVRVAVAGRNAQKCEQVADNIGPVSSVLEEHPNIIRTWRE